MAEPGTRGAEATLGAPASPLSPTSASRGLTLKARLPAPRKKTWTFRISISLLP